MDIPVTLSEQDIQQLKEALSKGADPEGIADKLWEGGLSAKDTNLIMTQITGVQKNYIPEGVDTMNQVSPASPLAQRMVDQLFRQDAIGMNIAGVRTKTYGNPWGMLFFGVLWLAATLGFFVVTGGTKPYLGTKTVGTVTRVEESRSSKGGTSYQPWYTYQVAGKTYTGHPDYYSSQFSGYTTGSNINLAYLDDQPQFAVPQGGIGTIVFFALFLVCGLFLFAAGVTGLLKPTKKEPQIMQPPSNPTIPPPLV